MIVPDGLYVMFCLVPANSRREVTGKISDNPPGLCKRELKVLKQRGLDNYKISCIFMQSSAFPQAGMSGTSLFVWYDNEAD